MSERTRERIEERMFTRSGLLLGQVLIAQACGFLIVALTPLMLGPSFRPHMLAGIQILIVTIAYMFLVFSPEIFPSGHPTSAKRLQRIRDWLGGLVVADTCIVISLVYLSGGVTRSHLLFVLVLIPGVLALVQPNGKTLFSITALIILYVAFDVFFPCLQMGALFAKGCFLSKLAHADASGSDGYRAASAMGIGIGLVTSLVQAHISGGQSLSERARSEVKGIAKKYLTNDTVELGRIIFFVGWAYHNASKHIRRTNEPDLHCSLVHPVEDLALQAYSLSLPCVKGHKLYGAFRTARMVFLIHWLDDLFDCRGYSQLENKNLNLATASSVDIGKRYSPHGVLRIIQIIKGERYSFRLWLRPSWKEGVEAGLIRVLLGGVVSNGGRLSSGALERIKSDMLALVGDHPLRDELKDANAAFYWGSCKTAMPLVLGMAWKPDRIENLGTLCAMLDTLFLPLLIWHNLEEEIKREELSRKGFEGKDIYGEIRQAVELSTRLIEKHNGILQQDADLWQGMKQVLRVINAMYGKNMPPERVYKDYKHCIEKLLAD